MLRLAIATIALTALLPATAFATVTATSQVSSTGISLTVRGDGAADGIKIACGSDGNAKVNGADPESDTYPIGSGAVACSDLTAITVDGGDGDDSIRLNKISPVRGFTNRKLCGPCADGGYAIVAECLAGRGGDYIKASPIGTLIGGCSGRRSMQGYDFVEGSSGDDAIAAGPGVDDVEGGLGDDQLFGGPKRDYLSGNAGDDLIVGKQGNDALFGNDGADRIAGGSGYDAMFGGGGDDSCIAGPQGGRHRDCESIRGVSRAASLGFAPRF